MQVGYRWLQDYITFPWDVEELADRLTAIGTAVDGIAPVFKTFTGVVAARIVSVTPHPDRPTLHVLRYAPPLQGLELMSADRQVSNKGSQLLTNSI